MVLVSTAKADLNPLHQGAKIRVWIKVLGISSNLLYNTIKDIPALPIIVIVQNSLHGIMKIRQSNNIIRPFHRYSRLATPIQSIQTLLSRFLRRIVTPRHMVQVDVGLDTDCASRISVAQSYFSVIEIPEVAFAAELVISVVGR